jgi:hypothetical protein
LREVADVLENLVSGLGPDERLRIRMMGVDEFANRGVQD